MEAVKDKIEKQDYSIAFGIVSRANECSVDRVIKEADELMLVNKKEYYRIRNQRDPR